MLKYGFGTIISRACAITNGAILFLEIDMKSALIGLCILILLNTCMVNRQAYWKTERNKVDSCYVSWQYEDLSVEVQLKVLLFNQKYRHDLHLYPNLIIGVTSNGDTIGIMDRPYSGSLKSGDQVIVLPTFWTAKEKELPSPSYVIHKRSTENDLYCVIDTVYYGKIDQ